MSTGLTASTADVEISIPEGLLDTLPFDVASDISETPIVKTAGGKINATLIVDEVVVLQRIRGQGPEQERSIKKFHRVAEHLADRDLVAVEPILFDGQTHFKEGPTEGPEGFTWWGSLYIPSDLGVPEIITEEIAEGFGRLLAETHFALNYGDLHKYLGLWDRPSFEETTDRLVGIKNDYQADELWAIHDALAIYSSYIGSSSIYSTGERSVIHGDTKFANGLFENGKLKGLLDYDLVSLGPLLHDIGDAVRSMVKFDLDNPNISIEAVGDRIAALHEGYSRVRESHGQSSPDLEHVILAGLEASLQLFSWYMLDAQEHDYFNFGDRDRDRYIEESYRQMGGINRMVSLIES